MDVNPIWFFAAFVASVAIYIVIREKINLRKAADGEDKERLRRAAARALPEADGFQVAYGHYEKVEYIVRKRVTTYYHYALVFDASRIWVMTLQFDKGLILPGKPVLITSDTLGVVDVNITNHKGGKARRVDFALYDKNGESLLNCVVEMNNTREDRFHHVNIIQEEECERFSRLIRSLSIGVSQDNILLKEQVHTREACARRAYSLGLIGSVTGVFLPPLGLVLSIMGLRNAKKVETGSERTVLLFICRTGLVLSTIFAFLLGGVLIHKFFK